MLFQKCVQQSQKQLIIIVISTFNSHLKFTKKDWYHKQMNNRKKIDSVLIYMRENYKWEMQEFIKVFITADFTQTWVLIAEKHTDILLSILSDYEKQLDINTDSKNFNLNDIIMIIHQELNVMSVNDNIKHLFKKFDQKFNIKQIQRIMW